MRFTASSRPEKRIWIAIRCSQWQSRANSRGWLCAAVPMATADQSRGRAQPKIAQLFLWTIDPPGQTAEQPVASHQLAIATGPLIKVYHF